MKIGHSEKDLIIKLSKLLKTDENDFRCFKIKKKSIDARDKKNIHYVYTVELSAPHEERLLKLLNVSKAQENEYDSSYKMKNNKAYKYRPVIAGSGPAGLFCGLLLAQSGMRPIILERGADVDQRIKDVEGFFKTGILNTSSNVLFGEGGAGTFSDGKLTTGIKDERISFILKTLTEHGAPDEIMYEAKPHIGTDRLAPTVKNIRKTIEGLGGEVRFYNKLKAINTSCGESKTVKTVKVGTPNGEYEIETDAVVLAIGHSARDTVEMLYSVGVMMKPKSFSVGFRIEHKREDINRLQYGDMHTHLPAADYKLAVNLSCGRGAYTFCMCPGGVVVASASEVGRLSINGMSRYGRDADNSNSAVLVSVTPADYNNTSPLGGIEFARSWEEAAFKAGGGNFFAPAQTVGDFLQGKKTTGFGRVSPSYLPGVKPVNFNEHFNLEFLEYIREAIVKMDLKLKGFADYEAVLTGVETRSSSPVTVLRNETYESNIKGLYPCGEGCGHAGGIISAAADGMKCAEAVIKYHLN